MILYHGSNVVVKKPEILQSGRMLDFGTGFYTTSNKEQAIRWAEKVSVRREPKNQVLSIYEIDFGAAKKELEIIHFDAPNAEWLDFVCNNRCGRKTVTPYDIVIGPVADDKVYSVIQFYENGVYNREDAIKRLKVEGLYNQILFHTEKALMHCHFTKFERLEA